MLYAIRDLRFGVHSRRPHPALPLESIWHACCSESPSPRRFLHHHRLFAYAGAWLFQAFRTTACATGVINVGKYQVPKSDSRRKGRRVFVLLASHISEGTWNCDRTKTPTPTQQAQVQFRLWDFGEFGQLNEFRVAKSVSHRS